MNRTAPLSTYRLQFNHLFTLPDANRILPYIDKLGISACYSSPLSKALPKSLHGYDVIDPTVLNPEIGSEEDFSVFANELKSRKMGLLLDIVPNHLCIALGANPWWNDVLENGPASSYSPTFDIDWSPPKVDLANKVLLPDLEDQFGRSLENQKIRILYVDPSFLVLHGATRYPLAPHSWNTICDAVLKKLREPLSPADPALLELESITTALSHLPPTTETEPNKLAERLREKEIIKKRFSNLINGHRPTAQALDEVLRVLNGTQGQPQSFNELEKILNEQVYRLCYWRVAADEINYRRFFDVNNLAAIHIEQPDVFNQVHQLPLSYIQKGWVTGLRVDHVDGLHDPKGYLSQLQNKCSTPDNGSCFVVVEKIISPEEKWGVDWPVVGTTGYDFLNDLNQLFVKHQNRRGFFDLYARFTGRRDAFSEIVTQSKKLVMLTLMASEVRVLATILDRISEQHRYSRDFTFESLRFALREVIAGFPVYRSYITPDGEVGPEDKKHIETAIEDAKRRNPVTDKSIFDFISDVLTLNHPEGLSEGDKADRLRFVLRLQQLTGPIMAKGLEDTAHYRFFPLVSLNEVGGDPDLFGITTKQFHARNHERAVRGGNGLLATTTHDTKRSEDVRARISVLSEIPTKWYRVLRQWELWNRHRKPVVRGKLAPDHNEEYLLYQTLIGIWPSVQPFDRAALIERVQNYMLKALKEAKTHTSWINPNEPYEKAVLTFVKDILTPGSSNKFLRSFLDFDSRISTAGYFTALSQVVIKIMSPGIPDFYQGTEVWNTSLVDPDNRQPVDYDRLSSLLESTQNIFAAKPNHAVKEMVRHLEDGRIKMHVTRQALAYRKRHEELFREGDYLPIDVIGEKKDHVCAFARRWERQVSIAVVGRFFLSLGDEKSWREKRFWRNTYLALPTQWASVRFRDILTGASPSIGVGRKPRLALSEIFGPLYVAVLEAEL